MLLFNEKLQVSAGSGAQQVPCGGMYDLCTPVTTTFAPSLEALLHDADLVPSLSNIYDSSQLMDSMDYSLLDEPFLSLAPLKVKREALAEEEASLAEEMEGASLFAPPNRTLIKVEQEEGEEQEGGGGSGSELAHVESLLMEHLSKEMGDTCDALYISPDPGAWSRDDVRKWIAYNLHHYNQPMVNLDYFDMSGPALCSLNENAFRQRASEPVADFLYAQLDLWKTAAGYHRQEASPSPPPSFQPEDSLLDISAYLQLPQTTTPTHHLSPHSPRMDECAGAEQAEVLSHLIHSDYSSDGGLQSDDDLSEDGLESGSERFLSASLTGSASAVTSPAGGRQGTHSHIHLWQFLKELLTHGQTYGSCIRWLDRSKGVFKIEDSVRVARLWGKRKNRPAMNYDKLSRSIRQYYKKGIMKKTERSQRLVYQFCHPYCL